LLLRPARGRRKGDERWGEPVRKRNRHQSYTIRMIEAPIRIATTITIVLSIYQSIHIMNSSI